MSKIVWRHMNRSIRDEIKNSPRKY